MDASRTCCIFWPSRDGPGGLLEDYDALAGGGLRHSQLLHVANVAVARLLRVCGLRAVHVTGLGHKLQQRVARVRAGLLRVANLRGNAEVGGKPYGECAEYGNPGEDVFRCHAVHEV